mmetsp:Transcript_5293/g.14617  ORF Transcript_5293/g.14617 Transcript_5293/m.14617 type:complete len:514 (+) Transcript_5293:3-1544(+)
MRRAWLTAKYMRTWFVLDLVSTCPWENLFSFLEPSGTSPTDDGGGQTTLLRIIKLGKLMRVLRLLRLAKINSLIMRFQSSGLLPASMYELKFGMSAVKMFIVFFFLSHWGACLWGWIGDPENIDGSAAGDPYMIETCTMGGPCEHGIEGTPWRRRYGLDNYSGMTQYLAALQFAAALITGGEAPMQPSHPVERMYTVVMMILSIFVSSIVVGEILLIMNRQSEMTLAFEDQMQQCREFMVAREVPLSLQVRIYRYMESQHRQLKRNASDDRSFMDHLSVWLQVQLVEYLHRTHIIRHPFFKAIPCEEALRRICLDAKPMIFANGDPIVEEAHLALCAHFLVRGKLRVQLTDGRGGLYLKPPCWIGDKCLFVDTLRTNTVVAISHTETLTVHKSSLQTVTIEFPEVATIYEEFRQKLLNNDLASLKCPICGDIGHSEETCPSRPEDAAARKTVKLGGKRRFSVLGSRASSVATKFTSSIRLRGSRDSQTESPCTSARQSTSSTSSIAVPSLPAC